MYVSTSSLKLSPHAFAKMSKLQFLEFEAKCDCPQGLQSLSSELRYLSWFNYPQATLAHKFCAEKLVILDLSYSKIIKLWDGVQNLVNLKQVKLGSCYNLLELPDFSKATNLEVLEARDCRELSGVHSSIFSLNKLNTLDLSWCGKIATLTSDTHLSSLSYLNFGYCCNLREFSVTSENMKKLDLTYVQVQALPSSFEHQSKLEILCLRGSDIEELPSCIKKLTRLQYLDISHCFRLETIPELPPSLQTLLAGCYYRGQLQTVCFPRVGEQLKENRKRVEFWNRSELDEQSLMAIGLNARINVMKFVHQHLPEDEAVYYVYPGSRVPEWMEHRTMEDSILIDLSSTPHFAFIFCFILGEHQLLNNEDELVFEIRMSDGAGEGEGNEDKGSATMCMPNTLKIVSDNVCLMYSQRCYDYLNSGATDLTRFNIKVTTTSSYLRRAEVDAPREVTLKGFGVSPIKYQSFSQQMDLER
ncbi:Leucine-rich repeat 3 [Sesbania bispinosa]|nr:Leucine-rich repeat 3 [Sesbania bispinosa]